MSLPSYAEYRNSGIPWLGRVPSHWAGTRVKRVSEFSVGWTPPTGNDEAYAGKNLWANISDLGPKIIFDTAKRISDDAIRTSRLQIARRGSLLFSFKLSVGQVSIAGVDMYTNEAIAAFSDCPDLHLAWAYYALPVFLLQNARENIYGANLLNQDLIRNADLVLPPPPEQRALADFLEHETGKIDVLIDEQKRLIELLNEKQQAVISQAVTKGLRADAAMRQSNAEWLGMVPAHWPLCPMRYLVKARKGRPAETAIDTNDGQPLQPYLSMEYLRDEAAIANRVRVAPSSVVVDANAVLLLWDGSNAGEFLRARPGVVSSTLAALEPQGLLPGFLFYVGKALEPHLRALTTGMGIPHVSSDVLGAFQVPKPRLEEQDAIAAYLDGESVKFEAQKQEHELLIALLQERRSALISKTVTGQIDVGQLLASEAA